jgi:hypothetical protein
MKKLFFLLGLLFAATGIQSRAMDTIIFNYDRVAMDSQMAQLDRLESYLIDNPQATISQMISECNPLVAEVSRSGNLNGISILNEKVLGIPSFMWGCCFGPIGILIVAITSKETKETMRAVYGLLTTIGSATVLIVSFYVFIYFMTISE